jgi:hypothetical protein
MKDDYILTQADLDWTRDLVDMIAPGGVWACPAGMSIWSKDSRGRVSLSAGPTSQAEARAEIDRVIAEGAMQFVGDATVLDAVAESVAKSNLRIIRCLKAIDAYDDGVDPRLN